MYFHTAHSICYYNIFLLIYASVRFHGQVVEVQVNLSKKESRVQVSLPTGLGTWDHWQLLKLYKRLILLLPMYGYIYLLGNTILVIQDKTKWPTLFRWRCVDKRGSKMSSFWWYYRDIGALIAWAGILNIIAKNTSERQKNVTGIICILLTCDWNCTYSWLN